MMIKITFDLELPVDGVTDGEIQDWLSYKLAQTNEMRITNPLMDYDIYADYGSLEWEEKIL